jgi:hypothetical protein
MRQECIVLLLGLSGVAAADTLTLRSGKVVTGTYLGGTARQVRMDTGDEVRTFDIGAVASVVFEEQKAAAAAPPQAPRRTAILRPDASETAAKRSVEVPSGTTLTIRMIDAVDSEVNQVGQTFRASLDEPVRVGSEIVIPRGADVLAKLAADKKSGKLGGRAELTMDLISVTVNGRAIDVNTQEVTTASESRSDGTKKKVAGGAIAGAVIGAIAGGGRGAAAGAAAGAGAGTAVQVFTKGQRVRIPSETRLTFTLERPLAF